MDLQSTYSWLLQIRRTESLIARKRVICEELRSCLDAGAIRYDGGRGHTLPVDRVGRIVAKVVDIEEQVKRLQEEKALLILELGDAVEKLPNEKEGDVLTAYYIQGLTMEQVAAKVGYSVQHTYRLRKRGVQHLSKRCD